MGASMSRRLLTFGVLIAVSVASVGAAGNAAAGDEDQKAERPNEPVFLSRLDKDGGAPSAEAVDDVVVLSEVDEDDPWFAAVRALRLPGIREVVRFRPNRLEAAMRRLGELRPGCVVVLVRPSTLDVNFHFELLEQASRLDDDPFVDFAFGYMTGRTPEEAVAFAEGIASARGTALPGVVLDFGPNPRPRAVTNGGPIAWAPSVVERELRHAKDDPELAATLASIQGVGIYRASGHGTPDRVIDGLTAADIRASGLRFGPSLYFSGPCWCGVTDRWFETVGGGVKERRVEPERSFLLALVASGSTAVFAGLDPDRGETSHHELEHLLATGEPLGRVAKSTWDDAVIAYRREKLTLPRYRDGKGSPLRDIHDNMISGGACRALYGDPTWAPVEAAGEEFFRVEKEVGERGLDVKWTCDGNLRGRWAPVDVFRAGGGWTHRVRFRLDISREEAKGLRRFEVVSVTKDGEEIPYAYPTAALESWGGGVRIHGYLVFPKQGNRGPLSGAKDLGATFRFRREYRDR